MAANRAPFVLQGVPILSCDRCQFFCSDERYLMAHMSVEHGENEKSVPKVAPGEVDDAVKQAIKAPPRRREIESAIESTSKTLSYLYAALLADPSEGPSPLIPKAHHQTTPLQLSPTMLASATPNSMISPSQQNTTPGAVPSFPSANSLETNQTSSDSQNRSASARKRRRSEDESTPAFRPGAFGPMGNLPLPAAAASTPNPSLNILNLLQISKMSNELEKRNALIETIKRARMANHAMKIEDQDEEIVVEPSEPKEEKESKGSDEDEIIEIPTEEQPALSQEPNFAQSLQNRMNPLSQLFQQQNLPKNSLAFPSSDSLVSRGKTSNMFPNFALQNSLLKFHESQQRDKKKSVSPVSGLDRNANSGLSLVGYHGAANGNSTANTGSSGSALVPKNPILCNICGSSWRTPSALNIHMRVHTGEKPYKCMICGKGHKQKGQLKVHINKHHPGQWPAVGNMLNQMIKDPKKCSMCGEVFVEPKELSKHILECAPTGLSIPPGQPRPSCDICGITFSSTLNFKRHMDSHRLDKGQSNAPSEVSDVSESNSESKSSAIQMPPGAPIHSPELMQKLKSQYELLPGAGKTWRSPSEIFYKSSSQAANLPPSIIPSMFSSASLLGQSAVSVMESSSTSPRSSPPGSNQTSRMSPSALVPENNSSNSNGVKTASHAAASLAAASLAASQRASSPLINVASTHVSQSSSPSPQISGFSVADQAQQATAIATE